MLSPAFKNLTTLETNKKVNLIYGLNGTRKTTLSDQEDAYNKTTDIKKIAWSSHAYKSKCTISIIFGIGFVFNCLTNHSNRALTRQVSLGVIRCATIRQNNEIRKI